MFSMQFLNHNELKRTGPCIRNGLGAMVRRTHPTFRSVGWRYSVEGRSSAVLLPKTQPKTEN